MSKIKELESKIEYLQKFSSVNRNRISRLNDRILSLENKIAIIGNERKSDERKPYEKHIWEQYLIEQESEGFNRLCEEMDTKLAIDNAIEDLKVLIVKKEDASKATPYHYLIQEQLIKVIEILENIE